MALPKRRTPKAKQQHRRSHHRIRPPHLVRCAACGSWRVSHRVCAACEADYTGAAGEGAAADAE